jgi:hypothetical protein
MNLYRIVPSLFLVLGPFISPISADPTQYDVRTARSYFDYFTEYYTNLNEDADMDEIIDYLVIMRQTILNQGLECPPIPQLCRDIIRHLFGQKIDVESEVLREFVERVEIREIELKGQHARPQIDFIRHHTDIQNPQKHYKIGLKGVYGFIKVLAGTLATFLPVPSAKAVGIGLIICGINEIVYDVREQGALCHE